LKKPREFLVFYTNDACTSAVLWTLYVRLGLYILTALMWIIKNFSALIAMRTLHGMLEQLDDCGTCRQQKR